MNNQNNHPERSETEWSAAEGPAVSAISIPKDAVDAKAHPLAPLRQFTPARIALGRTGNSLPTQELLQFSAAHAIARDAVHAPFDTNAIVEELTAARLESIYVHSAAADRTTYLRRPDLGRKLSESSRNRLTGLNPADKPELIFIIADGLSAIAPKRYAAHVILATRALLDGWKIGPVIIAEQARVALGDEIGELIAAEITVTLIGERPGLSSADSLGIYLTYAPKPGRTDAERNCISNVRDEGTTPQYAAQTLHYLLSQSRKLKLSGFTLKDESAMNTGSRELI